VILLGSEHAGDYKLLSFHCTPSPLGQDNFDAIQCCWVLEAVGPTSPFPLLGALHRPAAQDREYNTEIIHIITANLYYKFPLIRQFVWSQCLHYLAKCQQWLLWLTFQTLYHEAFAATQFNEMFSSRQPRQVTKDFRHFRNWLGPHLQGVVGGLVEPILVSVLSSHQQHSEGGDEVSPWNARKPSRFDAAVCPRTFHWEVYV